MARLLLVCLLTQLYLSDGLMSTVCTQHVMHMAQFPRMVQGMMTPIRNNVQYGPAVAIFILGV